MRHTDKQRIKKDVERAIDLLHEQDYVFGGLRSPNIMHVKGGGAMLIDIDWRGKAGKVRYPLNISLDSEMWAPGAGLNQLILKDHDKVLLKKWKSSL